MKLNLYQGLLIFFVLGFLLVLHGSLLLCIGQQTKVQGLGDKLKNFAHKIFLPNDKNTYNCPKLPNPVLEYAHRWIHLIPESVQKMIYHFYSFIGVDTINYIISLGTIALILDAGLIIYFTVFKPPMYLKQRRIGDIVRWLVVGFLGLTLIYGLAEQGIIPKFRVLSGLEYLQIDNLYNFLSNSCEFFTMKVKQTIKNVF